MQSLLDKYREVARRLNERIDQLAEDLLPNGRLESRRWWRVGSLAGEPGQSLAVELRGHKRGRWADYSSGEFGDGLDLVAQVKFHGDKREAFAWARDWLNLPEIERQPRPPLQRAAAVRETYADAVQRIWREARPLQRGDPVDQYLCERAIELAKLGRAPKSLRYHPQLWNKQSQRSWPAMVAAIIAPNGALCAVHCTWLERDPFGVTKAPIPDGGAKRTIGSYRGGCVPLWRGMPGGEIAMVGEGIEDTLSGVFNGRDWRALCAVSLSSMLALELLPEIKTVVILGQNDEQHWGSASPAARLLWKVIRRWDAEGRQVRVVRPPAFFKDFNDLAVWGRQSSIEVGWLFWGEHERGAGEQRAKEGDAVGAGDPGRGGSC